MSYTTGEIAKLCGVTVRAVQFYDREGLLPPEDYSEGGRRLYGENSLKTLQLICVYKNLGLSLFEIKSVIADGSGGKILLSVLEEREKTVEQEIRERLSQRDGIKAVKECLAQGRAMSPEIYLDMQTIMEGKKRLKITYAFMAACAVIGFAGQTISVVLWAVLGMWLPFAIIMPCVFAIMAAIVTVYYKNTAYICSDCGKKFKPKFGEFMFAKHTPKTRKLVCPHCGSKKFHVETYSDL